MQKRLTPASIVSYIDVLPPVAKTIFTVDGSAEAGSVTVQEHRDDDGTTTRFVIVKTRELAELSSARYSSGGDGKRLVGLMLSFLLTAFTLPAWAIEPDEPIELVSSERMGFKYHNFKRLQPFGPKRYTYRTRAGGNLQSLVHIKTVPDRRPSEQRHPLESTSVKIVNYTLYALALKRGG